MIRAAKRAAGAGTVSRTEWRGLGTYLAQLQSILGKLPLDRVLEICDILFRAYAEGHTVFPFGNGGSAALASHLVSDLSKGTLTSDPRVTNSQSAKRFKVLALTDNVPLMTAWANDFAYEDIYSQQLATFVQPGDVAFAISGSGNSPNVLKALEFARNKGVITVGLTGFEGGKMIAYLDCGIVVPSSSMQQIEDAHVILTHMIFLELKSRIGQFTQSQNLMRTSRGGAK